MLSRGKTGYYGLVGPRLTEGVDESALTVNALWEAVTGKPGTQTAPDAAQQIRAAQPLLRGPDPVHHRSDRRPARERVPLSG
ncbi:hypothetical protein OIB37_35415 [Streptomyces sp. NBC_00820]|uniref:hypothetical protein n=1 Tax=Streptomyces sp. NBC_00820 TaxID=2975842 RepID=UPI002ED3CFB9|nr:hypothetical protein OIB37_35415 [Streptomyces sp. NBC_00820]